MENLKDGVLAIYKEVSTAVDGLVKSLRAKNEENDEDIQKPVDNLIGNIESKKKAFEGAVEELARDSEFDKFTIAFFGQTNAGKSTIIEALRILSGEESRKAKIAENLAERERLEKESDAHCKDVLLRLEALRKCCREEEKPFWKRYAWHAAAFAAGVLFCRIFL